MAKLETEKLEFFLHMKLFFRSATSNCWLSTKVGLSILFSITQSSVTDAKIITTHSSFIFKVFKNNCSFICIICS